jgi:hypothetical protein
VQGFLHDTTGFNAFDIDSLAGVVTDVEDLDWSLPGGFDRDSTFFDGGVLIWHIDEAVIAQGLQANGVNANPLRRGVDLEEADGSQDIGQQYEFLSPGSGSEEGTALDFWYPGNGSPVNKNIFSPTSHPDSRSNSGANSHITIADFGPVVPKMSGFPRMTAKVTVGDNVVKLLPGFPKHVGEKLTFPQSLAIGDLSGNGGSDIIVCTTGERVDFASQIGPIMSPPSIRSKLYAWRPNGAGVFLSSPLSGVFARGVATQPDLSVRFGHPPSINDLNGDGIADVVVGESSPEGTFLHAFASQDVNNDSLADDLFTTRIGLQSSTIVSVLADSVIALGASNGWVYFFRLTGVLIDSLRFSGSPVDINVGLSRGLASNSFVVTANSNGTITVTTRKTSGGTTIPDVVRNFGENIPEPASSGMVGSEYRIAFTTIEDNLFVVDASLNVVSGFPIHISGLASSRSPAIADVDGDGLRDIIVFAGNRIYAFNRAGASLDNFPITIPTTNSITSSPVIADVNGDGNTEVVAVAGDGVVVAYDKTGHMAPGFPLQAGTGSQSAAVFVQGLPLNSFGINLAVASSTTGSVIAWQTGNVSFAPTNLPWPQYQKDAQHSGLALEPLIGAPLSSEFFPKGRAYNWPNPVYEGRTFIRYFVKDNATVNIKVFDLAGDLVTTIPSPPGVGGVDNEVEWKVGDVQSGIYFARIEANGGGGNGVAVIKIAVVK